MPGHYEYDYDTYRFEGLITEELRNEDLDFFKYG